MFEYTTAYFDTPPQKQRAIDFWFPRLPSQPQAHSEHSSPPPALFFVHGGGWKGGHRENQHPLMHAFLEHGYPSASVDYRLGGATIAEQLADVRLGLAHFATRLQERGLPPRIVIYGSSAGSHLALFTALAKPGACGEAVSPETAAALATVELLGIISSCGPCTMEPWPDIFPVIWADMERAVGTPHAQAPALYRLYSPKEHVSPEAPPILFLMGEFEHLFPNAHTVQWAEELRARGLCAEAHIYPMAEHGFFYDTTRRPQQMAFADCLRFLKRCQGE